MLKPGLPCDRLASRMREAIVLFSTFCLAVMSALVYNGRTAGSTQQSIDQIKGQKGINLIRVLLRPL